MPSSDDVERPAADETRSFAFSFVCQKGELEIGAVLLAASLKRFLCCRHELVAAIPTPAADWGEPSTTTLDLLRQIGVRTVAIENPVDPAFTQANRIMRVGIPTGANKVVLLDSDMLCVSTFGDEPRFSFPFNAKPTDLQTSSEDVWQEAYAAVGVEMPSLRLPATVSGELAPPSFDTGFVAVAAGVPLGKAWAECAPKITARLATVEGPRPRARAEVAPTDGPADRVGGEGAGSRRRLKQRALWLDQLSLAIAVQHLGLEIDCLDERYNHPTHCKPLDAGRSPFFSHYHYPHVIRREPSLLALVHELVETYPRISELIGRHKRWTSLLQPRCIPGPPPWRRLVPRRPPGPSEVIVTGISRSGTSYLCNLLHRFDNCIAINEPREIISRLRDERIPWGVPLYYRETRRDVLDGTPIKNKLRDGEVVEDTALGQTRRRYRPTVAADDFVLAVKNTREFLFRLEPVRRVMPTARIVACVRNPFDTIASWKASFHHQRDADVTPYVEHPSQLWLPEQQRAVLQRISTTSDLAERRALWWWLQAQHLLENSDEVVLVDYDDLVRQPATVLRRIFHGYRPGRPRQAITPSVARPKRGLLDDDDRRAIRAICSQAAADLHLATLDSAQAEGCGR